MMVNYMVKVIEIHLRIIGKCDSINAIYDSCRDTIVYSNKELNQIFDSVRLTLKVNIILNMGVRLKMAINKKVNYSVSESNLNKKQNKRYKKSLSSINLFEKGLYT